MALLPLLKIYNNNKMKDKTGVVIVTGSSGMIGSALIHNLVEQYHVVGFDPVLYKNN